jgi:hypothetical protein
MGTVLDPCFAAFRCADTDFLENPIEWDCFNPPGFAMTWSSPSGLY